MRVGLSLVAALVLSVAWAAAPTANDFAGSYELDPFGSFAATSGATRPKAEGWAEASLRMVVPATVRLDLRGRSARYQQLLSLESATSLVTALWRCPSGASGAVWTSPFTFSLAVDDQATQRCATASRRPTSPNITPCHKERLSCSCKCRLSAAPARTWPL